MSKWTGERLGEPSPTASRQVNNYFKELAARSQQWERNEPRLPEVERPKEAETRAQHIKDAAANQRWVDWYASRPNHDEALKRKHNIRPRGAGAAG